MDTSGIHLQKQKCMQNTSGEWTGVSNNGKENRTMHYSVRGRNLGGGGRGNRSVTRTGPALSRCRN